MTSLAIELAALLAAELCMGRGFCRVTEVPNRMIGALKLIFGRFAGGAKPAIPGRAPMLACCVPGGAPVPGAPIPGGGGMPGGPPIPGAVPGGIPKPGGTPETPIPPNPGGMPGGIPGRPNGASAESQRRATSGRGRGYVRPGYWYIVFPFTQSRSSMAEVLL